MNPKKARKKTNRKCHCGLLLSFHTATGLALCAKSQLEARKPAKKSKRLLSAYEKHARLMHRGDPFLHDGWMYCKCSLAAQIRAEKLPPKPDIAQEIHDTLFKKRRDGRKLALPMLIWPDPKPQILAAIREVLRRYKIESK